MRSAIFLSALAGLAAAAPQAIDFDAVEAIPEPTLLGPNPTATAETVTLAAASTIISAMVAEITAANTKVKSKMIKRGDCSPQPLGSGDVTSPDTAEAFKANPAYAAMANALPATVGAYTIVPGFRNLGGSLQQTGYAGLVTLTSYDPVVCAAECDRNAACQSFDIYIERDPTVDPGTGCPNPSSTVNYKCTLYDYPIAPSLATNNGEFRGPADANGVVFQVIVLASNGYNKAATPITVDGFGAPAYYGDAAINAPSSSGSYITFKTFDTGKFDPTQCGVLCKAQTAYNKAHPAKGATTYRPCNYYNAYVLLKNGQPQGTYCSLYTQPWDATYATNRVQYRGSDKYTISSSFGYTLNPQDSGVLAPSGQQQAI